MDSEYHKGGARPGDAGGMGQGKTRLREVRLGSKQGGMEGN